MTDAHDDLPRLPKVEQVKLLCNICNRHLPEKAFKDRRGHSLYTGKCLSCQQSSTTAAKSVKKAIAESDKAMSIVRKIEAPHVSELVEEIMRTYQDRNGGNALRNFARSLRNTGDAIMADDPGSKKALDYHMGIAKLIIASTTNRQSAPDVEHLSDEDLEREARQLLTIHVPKEKGDADVA